MNPQVKPTARLQDIFYSTFTEIRNEMIKMIKYVEMTKITCCTEYIYYLGERIPLDTCFLSDRDGATQARLRPKHVLSDPLDSLSVLLGLSSSNLLITTKVDYDEEQTNL